MRSGMFFPPYGDTIGSVVVKHVNGQLVDVLTGDIHPACVNFFEGRVVRIERKITAPLQYILPGLIDSRVRIESSSLTPFRFAEQAAIHGTTAVIADPTPVAGAMGMAGIDLMVENARSTPLRFYFAAPSSLPSTSGLDWKAMRNLLARPEFVALAEVDQVGEVLAEDAEVMAKIEVARQAGKPIDGLAPGLRGYDLDRYIMTGISSDRACASVKDAEEKKRRGMEIVVERGSAHDQFEELAGFMRSNRFLLASGELAAYDLVGGYVDEMLRRAVDKGVEPLQAIRAATLWPAERYDLFGGSLYVGGPADMTIVSDLKDFRVLETWVRGEMVAKEGRSMFLGNPTGVGAPFTTTSVTAEDIELRRSTSTARVKALEVNPLGLGAGRGNADLAVQGGKIVPDPRRDIALFSWIDPWREGKVHTSFVRGFGLTEGAMATTYSAGAAGVLAVGTDAASVADAINFVLKAGGGKAAVKGACWSIIALPEGGMMSSLPAKDIGTAELELRSLIREMGCQLPDPMLSLSYLGREARWAFDLEPVIVVPNA